MSVIDFDHEHAVRRMDWTRCTDEMPEVGLVVRIRCADALSSYDVPGRYFLHEDGRFYGIEPPTIVEARVTHWVKA